MPLPLLLGALLGSFAAAPRFLIASEAALIARTQESIRQYLCPRLEDATPPPSPEGKLCTAKEFFTHTYASFSAELLPLPPDDDALDREESPEARQQRSWLQVLQSEHEAAAPQASYFLLGTLLACDDTQERATRIPSLFSAFVEAGGFAEGSSPAPYLGAFAPVNYTLFLNFILQRGPEANHLLLPMGEAFFSSDPQRSQRFKKAWLKKNSLPLLQHFLGQGNHPAARLLLKKISALGLRFLHRRAGKDEEQAEDLKFYCPLLEAILTTMDLCEGQPQLYRAAKKIRHECLAQLAREILQHLQKKPGDHLYFYHLVRYLTCPEKIFLQLRKFSGLERLFFYSPMFSHSILTTVLAQGNLLALEKIYYLVKNPSLIFPAQQCSVLHLLVEALSTQSPLQSIAGENSALLLLTFFFTTHSPLHSSDALSQALLLKNYHGFTPLDLAARRGFPLLFAAMKRYLDAEEHLHASDHREAKEREIRLREGLSLRVQQAIEEAKVLGLPLASTKINRLVTSLDTLYSIAR